MLINLYTLIRNLLITFTRDIKLVELIRVLTGEAEKAFNEFNTRVADWNYKINANASTISLQHHIKRELDVDAVITELEGTPIDFLVTITGFVDENRLRVLIDDYKLAGRSYVFVAGSEVFTAKFSNWYCEDLFIDNLFTPIFSGYTVHVTSKFNVASTITISLKVQIVGLATQYVNVVIVSGTKISNMLGISDNHDGSPQFVAISKVNIMSVDIAGDYMYNYVFLAENEEYTAAFTTYSCENV